MRNAARPIFDLVLMSHWDSLSIVGELKMPVLFLAGEDDEVVPHEQMLALHRQHRDYTSNGNGSAAAPVDCGATGQRPVQGHGAATLHAGEGLGHPSQGRQCPMHVLRISG